MSPDKVRALLSLIGSKHTETRGPWIIGPCPFAHWLHDGGKDAHPSFGIQSTNKKKSIYKCFSCGMGGDLFALHIDLLSHFDKNTPGKANFGKVLELVVAEQDELEFDPDIPDYPEDKPAVDIEFPESWLHNFRPYSHFNEAQHYLASRQGTPKLWAALDLRYDPFAKRVCFPFRNSKGLLMGVQGRAITKASPRYYFYPHPKGGTPNMSHWMGENHCDFDKPLVLVEGPFDYASILRVYRNVLASFSAGISDAKMTRLSDTVEVITFFDAGKGGDQARKKIKKTLTSIPIVDIVPTDADKDAGAMTQEEVSMLLQPHVKLDPFVK